MAESKACCQCENFDGIPWNASKGFMIVHMIFLCSVGIFTLIKAGDLTSDDGWEEVELDELLKNSFESNVTGVPLAAIVIGFFSLFVYILGAFACPSALKMGNWWIYDIVYFAYFFLTEILLAMMLSTLWARLDKEESDDANASVAGFFAGTWAALIIYGCAAIYHLLAARIGWRKDKIVEWQTQSKLTEPDYEYIKPSV